MKKSRYQLLCIVFSLIILCCLASCNSKFPDVPNSYDSQDTQSENNVTKPNDEKNDETNESKYNDVTVPTFILNEVTAKPGDQKVALEIYAKNNPGIASIALSLSYNTDYIQLTDFCFNSQIGGQFVPFNPNVTEPKLVWMNWSENVEGDWVFATLYFDIAKEAPEGKIPISVTYNSDDVYNLNEENISFGIMGGSILVK